MCGMSSQTVVRSICRKTTCGELKRQLGVSRLMSCGQTLKNDHTFFDNEVIHVLGRLPGGMEVNWDKWITFQILVIVPDFSHCLPLYLCRSRSLCLLSSLCGLSCLCLCIRRCLSLAVSLLCSVVSCGVVPLLVLSSRKMCCRKMCFLWFLIDFTVPWRPGSHDSDAASQDMRRKGCETNVMGSR